MYNAGKSETISYLIFGVLTTLVDWISYAVFRHNGMNYRMATICCQAAAILFAYVVNSRFVFHDQCATLADHIRPFLKFVSARLVTMVIEVGGVWLLAVVLGFHDMVAKFCTQFIVLVLNYIFSKFIIFTTGKKTGGSK